MFYYSFTSQVVLKHLNEFGASIIVDFKRKNKLKERHVEDGGIGGGGGSIELSGRWWRKKQRGFYSRVRTEDGSSQGSSHMGARSSATASNVGFNLEKWVECRG